MHCSQPMNPPIVPVEMALINAVITITPICFQFNMMMEVDSKRCNSFSRSAPICEDWT